MKNILKVITAVIILVIASGAAAKRLHPERWYQERWCERHGGECEVVLRDGTRCDCVTKEYAIEFDFADKWAESLAQALHYALMTGKKPGIVLILEAQSDWKYYYRLAGVIASAGIECRVWVVMEKRPAAAGFKDSRGQGVKGKD